MPLPILAAVGTAAISMLAYHSIDSMVQEPEEGMDHSLMMCLLDLSSGGSFDPDRKPSGLTGQLLDGWISTMPTTGLRPISQRVDLFLNRTGGNATLAIQQYDASQKDIGAKLKAAAAGAIPFLGEALNTVRMLWRQVRLAGFVAHACGHDLNENAVKLRIMVAIYAERHGLPIEKALDFFQMGIAKSLEAPVESILKHRKVRNSFVKIMKGAKKGGAGIVKKAGLRPALNGVKKAAKGAVQQYADKLPMDQLTKAAKELTKGSKITSMVSKSVSKSVAKGAMKTIGVVLGPAMAVYENSRQSIVAKAAELFCSD